MPAELGRWLALCVLMALIILGAFLMSVFIAGFLLSVGEEKKAPKLIRFVNLGESSRPKTFMLRALLWAGAILGFVLFVKVGSTLAGSLWRALN